MLQNKGQPEKCFGHFESPVIDMLTGFTIAVPIKNKNAETICEAYRDNIYCVFGGSSRMLTDNGSEFKNKEMH